MDNHVPPPLLVDYPLKKELFLRLSLIILVIVCVDLDYDFARSGLWLYANGEERHKEWKHNNLIKAVLKLGIQIKYHYLWQGLQNVVFSQKPIRRRKNNYEQKYCKNKNYGPE